MAATETTMLHIIRDWLNEMDMDLKNTTYQLHALRAETTGFMMMDVLFS